MTCGRRLHRSTGETPRVQESCAVPELTDPLAEVNLLLEQREKRKEGTSIHDRTRGRWGDTPCSVKKTSSTGWTFSSFTMRVCLKKRVTNWQYMITKPRLDEAGDSVRPCGALTNFKDQPAATLDVQVASSQDFLKSRFCVLFGFDDA